MQTLWEKTGCAAAVSDNERGLLSCDRKFANLFGVDSPDLLVGIDVRTLRKNLAEMVSAPDEVAPDEIALKDGGVMRVVEFDTGPRSLWLGVDVTPYKRQLEEYKRRERLLLQQRNEIAHVRPSQNWPALDHTEQLAASLPMIASLRYDLLTPINAINSFAQLLAKPDAPKAEPTYKELLDDIVVQSSQLRALVGDIVSRGGLFDASERSTAEPDNVIPSALIKNVLRNLSYTTRHAHLSFREGTSSSKTVETDERALRAVMLQALTGIVELTPSGGEVDVKAGLRNDTIIVRINSDTAGRDFTTVGTASKTLSMCGHSAHLSAHLFGAKFNVASGSNKGVSAELHWPTGVARRRHRASVP